MKKAKKVKKVKTQIPQPKRLLMQWHLSDRCNLRCRHCYQDSYSGTERGLSDWKGILQQYLDFLKARPGISGHINVTGGEPFAIPEFPALMDLLAEHRAHFSVGILSNGTLIDKALAAKVRDWGVHHVQVSLEGTRATHDAIRGEGSFDAAVKGLQALCSAGIQTVVAFTALRSNWREFPELVNLANKLGVWRIWADRLIPNGQADCSQVMTPAETEAFFSLMADCRPAKQIHFFSKASTEVAMHRALQFLAGGSVAYRCTAGDTLITVMPDGTLYPCRRLPISVGNIYETPLSTLYDCELFQRLRDPHWVSEGCENCLFRSVCRGGLRCLSYATTGRFDVADPGCWLSEQHKSATSTTAAASSATATPTTVTAAPTTTPITKSTTVPPTWV